MADFIIFMEFLSKSAFNLKSNFYGGDFGIFPLSPLVIRILSKIQELFKDF